MLSPDVCSSVLQISLLLSILASRWVYVKGGHNNMVVVGNILHFAYCGLVGNPHLTAKV